jgi:peptidoglycan-associated lipoprotein
MPAEDAIGSKTLDDLNRDSPLRPLFFELDSADVSSAGQQVLQANAAVLKKYPGMQITIEGHCDERGTEQYNLSLGERRALAVREYLVTAGISAARVFTISYGESRPAVPGHNEAAWSKNRRGAFVLLTPK